MRNIGNEGGNLLRLLDEGAEDTFVCFKCLRRVLTVFKLAQLACEDVGPRDGQRRAHPGQRRRSVRGVSQADDA